jgi:hypothetical protein
MKLVMKSVSMSWAMSALIALCVTPGLSGLTSRGAPFHPMPLAPMTLAQNGGPVALPGSADAPGSNTADDDDDQAGQASAPDDPDSAEQPPADMQQPPADDGGDDTYAQPPVDDNGDQGAPPADNDDN